MSEHNVPSVVRGTATHTVYPVTVDYTQSLADMIAAGKYDYRNEYITAENFPIAGEGVINIEIILVHFNRDIESDDAMKELEQMGLRPATLPELLAFGAKNPDVQSEFPIVALSSIWVDQSGIHNVPYLLGWIGGRGLDFDWWLNEWDDGWRFAAVRTTSPRLRGSGIT